MAVRFLNMKGICSYDFSKHAFDMHLEICLKLLRQMKVLIWCVLLGSALSIITQGRMMYDYWLRFDSDACKVNWKLLFSSVIIISFIWFARWWTWTTCEGRWTACQSSSGKFEHRISASIWFWKFFSTFSLLLSIWVQVNQLLLPTLLEKHNLSVSPFDIFVYMYQSNFVCILGLNIHL